MSENERAALLRELAYLNRLMASTSGAIHEERVGQRNRNMIPQLPHHPRGRSSRGGRGGRGQGFRGQYPRAGGGAHYNTAPPPVTHHGCNGGQKFTWRRTNSSNTAPAQLASNIVRNTSPAMTAAQVTTPHASKRLVKAPAKTERAKRREVVIRSPASSGLESQNTEHSRTHESKNLPKRKRKVVVNELDSKTAVENKYAWHSTSAKVKRGQVTPHRLSSSFSSPLMASTPIYNCKNSSSPKLNIRPQRILKSKHKIVNRVSSSLPQVSKYKVDRKASQIQKQPPGVYKLKSRYRLVKKAVNTQHMMTARRTFTALRRRSNLNWPSAPILSEKQRKLPACSSKFKVDRRRPLATYSLNRRMVLLRGTKFSVQKSGLSLRRISTSTTVHNRSRSLAFERASLVLNWSIKRAIHKGRKSSLKYCIYYNRFGRCYRGNKCPNTHDPKRVAVCTRFLRGTCKITDCAFSHVVAAEKMPTCEHFLRGACSRDHCPYLHVKVSENAEVCPAFAIGFCPLADKCKKKHILPPGKKRHSFRTLSLPAKRLKKENGKRRKFIPPQKSSCVDDEADDRHLPMRERTLPSFISLAADSSSDLSTDFLSGRERKEEVQLIRPRLPFNK